MADVSEQVRADVRTAWGGEPLRGFWERAREALESPKRPDRFSAELPDERTRAAVSEVYGRELYLGHSRIMLAKLDRVLRSDPRFELDLAQVLEILHGRPVASPDADAPEPESSDPALAALSAHGLDRARWARPWARWLHQYGRVSETELAGFTARAAAVLAALALDPATTPVQWVSRSDLAAPDAPHELDDGGTLSRIVLRAAALAHDVEPPGGARERQALWERCGVAVNDVAGTVLSWALPLTGDDSWSRSITGRTELGLPTHLTHRDLVAAPERLVERGVVVAVCENPRVLEAAVRAGIRHPLVCLSGHPSTVALALLRRLHANGARLRYHGDFDWTGVTIARSLWSEHEVGLWRMSAADYREAVDLAARDRSDLPNLVGTPVETPWDPQLAELMSTASRAVEEETVLPALLADLRDAALS
ncbi:TIGR02679 family protein [Saccharopolyspora gloriosae]|uniref:TIGR02679 family protein n=1 Tax=Saccharopolyspora gloriosae TaxID=455344 RepID=UPI001FB6383A|nr:TIGR02679 family protein [Saccharopolyspora gloriosae]